MGFRYFNEILRFDPTEETPGRHRIQVDPTGRIFLWWKLNRAGTNNREYWVKDPIEPVATGENPEYDPSPGGGGYISWPDETQIDVYIDGTLTWSFTGDNIQVNGVDPYGTATCRAEGLYPSTTSGCADPVLYETSSNKQNIYLADFDGASTEYAEFPLSMPDGWDGGTFRFRFKFAFTDVPSAPGSTVIWGAQMLAYGDRDDLDAAWGSAQEVTYTNTGSETGKYMVSDWTSAVTPAGTPAAGEDVQVRIYRDGGTDTTNVDARFRMVQVDFQRSAFSD
jgi:hypothetical protein